KAPRKRLRRSVVLYGLYAVVIAGKQALLLADASPTLVSGFGVGAETFEILIIINLSALALFDLLLHVVGWDYPDILHDLTVGAAYVVAFGWLLHRSGVDFTSIVATSAVV